MWGWRVAWGGSAASVAEDVERDVLAREEFDSRLLTLAAQRRWIEFAGGAA